MSKKYNSDQRIWLKFDINPIVIPPSKNYNTKIISKISATGLMSALDLTPDIARNEHVLAQRMHSGSKGAW